MSLKKIAPLAGATAFVATFLVPLAAFAADPATTGGDTGKGGAYIGAGIAMGLAVLGGGLGQGRQGAAALEGIARNPSAASKIQTPMLIALALTESLVLFALLVAYLLQSK
ncbi:MAG TPA: ATP synthase F0 subunit C [Polyangiaceae bacterium]|jgi:F-type H+-transporting ATPase subunit c